MPFLRQYAAEAGKGGGHIAPEAMALLCQNDDWPGNVRELEHVVERAVALTANPVLLAADLSAKPQRPAPAVDAFPSRVEMQKCRLQLALEKATGDRKQTALRLGVSCRTQYRMAKRHGLFSDALQG